MTFNIKSAVRGLDKVAAVTRSAQPDIVALQEVDHASRRSRGLDQTAALAARTGLGYGTHFRTTDLRGGGYGIALLSRFPLESTVQRALPVPRGAEPRTVAHGLVQVAGRGVSVYATHLIPQPYTSATRARQSEVISGLLADDPRPRLLMGDLNDLPDSLSVRLLRRELTDAFVASGRGPGETFPMPRPFSMAVRLDYVLASQAFLPLCSEVLRVNASDHYPLLAHLRLTGLQGRTCHGARVSRRRRSGLRAASGRCRAPGRRRCPQPDRDPYESGKVGQSCELCGVRSLGGASRAERQFEHGAWPGQEQQPCQLVGEPAEDVDRGGPGGQRQGGAKDEHDQRRGRCGS